MVRFDNFPVAKSALALIFTILACRTQGEVGFELPWASLSSQKSHKKFSNNTQKSAKKSTQKSV